MKRDVIIKRLGEVCDLRRGLTYCKDDEALTSSKRVLRSNNIDIESMSLDLTEIKYLREDYNIPKEKMLQGGSVFLCMSNGSKQHVGKVAYIGEDMNYAFGGFMGLIVPSEQLQPKYVYYVCRSSLWRDFMTNIGKGIGITNLRFSELSDFSIPVPPIEEQKAICDELDSLSFVIEKKKEQIKQLDTLAQSIFYDTFGDPITNEKGWKVKKLSDVSTLLNGRAYKQDELLSEGKYKVLRVGNFFTNGDYYYSNLELDEDKYCDNGDLLFAWSASFGAFIWSGNKVIYHYHIWKVLYDESKLNKLFYQYLLNLMTQSFMKDVHGIGMVHLTKAGMEQYNIPIPPLAIQQSFAKKVEAIERQKDLINQSIREVQTLFDSRMDYYFGD